jgi:transcriptional regulator GlxA family with amidase domain
VTAHLKWAAGAPYCNNHPFLKTKIMKIKKIHIAFFAVLLIGAMFMNACSSLRNFTNPPKAWSGESRIKSVLPGYDQAKKTVFIIADPKLTEMFDMLAPFYLFNATEKANVYIVAKEKTPILIKRDLFVMPQLSFSEADSMKLKADVIVIPALSIRDEHQDTLLISWIKKHFTPVTKMLTICDGASTGAATGLYDGKSITAHASDYEGIKSHFDKPLWVQNVTVAKAGNLFSTAGVSNAVEGSLLVIEELFGAETRNKVATAVNYPHAETRLTHQSIALDGGDKFAAAKKVFLKKNRRIGILLENGMDEFTLATILDTYGRTFPSSFKTYILHDSTVVTKYGLSFIYTGNNDIKGLYELHLAMPATFSDEDAVYFKGIKTVQYNNKQKEYLFNTCLKRIGEQYGHSFENFVKISLDYN